MQTILTVEELCKRLRPILGEKIDRLYLTYTFSDDRQKKAEIEQVLNSLYLKHLNANLLQEQVLFEPPPAQIIKGDYSLGIISYAEKELHSFGLREQDWVRHVCICGMSGSGKTNFTINILRLFVEKNKPFLVLDWKKSFRPLLALDPQIHCYTTGNNGISNTFRININKPPKNVRPKEWINLLCDIINESFFASHGVHKLLSETLDEAFRDFGVYNGSENYPTWFQIKDRLEEKERGFRGRESEWLTSALRIAHSLTFGDFGEAINYKAKDVMTVEDLLNQKVIFELYSLNGAEKKFFCEYLLTYIYKYKKTNEVNTDKFNYAIVVDEAHNIFLKDKPIFIKETVTDQVYREIREYGTGLICSDQHISKLSEVVAGNSACIVAFQQLLPQDIDTISRLMQIHELRKNFSMLPVGTAIVQLAERHHNPFLIKVPLLHIRKQNLTDDYVKERMKQIGKQHHLRKIIEECKVENVKKQPETIEMQKLMDHQGIQADLDTVSQLFITPPEPVESVHNETHPQDVNPRSHRQDFTDSVLRKLEITEEHKEFLNILKYHPGMNVSEVYGELGISGRKGNQLKNELIEMGYLDVEEIRSEKGWRKILKLTDKAKMI